MARIANDNDGSDGVLTADDNIIQPFQLQISGLRGRIVRLGSVIDDIIAAHHYPDEVSHLLADTVTLAVALSSMLKFDGIFTLQASGNGVVRSLVSDIDEAGNVRGCATFDAEALTAKKPDKNGIYGGYTLTELTGEGYLAFTVDQGPHTERYQGIVALEGGTLRESVGHYFEQSEQLRTSLYAASRRNEDGRWRSGALLLQFLPEEAGKGSGNDESVVTFNDKTEAERREDWQRSRILLQTCTDDEILSTDLHSNELLRRLFHEEGVIVYDPKPVRKNCRCSMERVRNIVANLGEEDRQHAAKDGKIEMTCEFCSKTYTMAVDDIES